MTETENLSATIPDSDAERKRIEEGYQIRLKAERQKREEEASRAEENAKRAEELSKQLTELQKRFESGRATQQETQEYLQANKVRGDAEQAGVPVERIPEILEADRKFQKFMSEFEQAGQKDPELKNMLHDPNSLQKISGEDFVRLSHLDNGPAVFKHLMQDKLDLQAFKAAVSEGNFQATTFLNNLSRQLDSTAKFPRPSGFKPTVSLDDVGAADGFNLSNYIDDKYR